MSQGITIPAGSVIEQDDDGYYAVLPDGTRKRVSITVRNGVTTIVATRVRRDGKVDVETAEWRP